MTQPIIKELFDEISNSKLNDEKEKFVEDEITRENNNEQINELNGIIEVKYKNKTYKIWKVEFIRPFIYKFLKEKYPDSLIVRELNNIDIILFDNILKNKIPIEIQKTPITEIKTFKNSTFEGLMRKQIEDNIETYNKCWIFIDLQYLSYLQSGNVGKTTSINMTWIIKLMKEKDFKVFAIKYDGTVKELTTKDFDFLKDLSQISEIGYDNDERILNRNKLEIYYNVINGYNFTQEEISQFENEFDNRTDESINSSEYFMKNDNKKCRLYGYILDALGRLSNMNNNLDCKSNKNIRILSAVTLGLFYQNEFSGQNNHATIQFVDKFNVAQYFPGYIRNKQLWNYCKRKQRIFPMDQFRGIIEGTFNYEFLKKQSTMEDF